MAGEVLVDALPYIDLGYDEPGVKQAALALVEEECRRYKPSKNYLDILDPLSIHAFETDILKNEFDRMEKRLPMDLLNFKRYELPPPPPNKQTDAAAWYECVENSYAQLEHQASRLVNLEIMSEYGSNAWRLNNQTLTDMFGQAEKQLETLKKQIQATNLSRKTEQTYAGVKLRSLEQNWVGLVSKNYEIECALAELEKKLCEIKKEKSIATVLVASELSVADEPAALSKESNEMEPTEKNLSEEAANIISPAKNEEAVEEAAEIKMDETNE